MDLLTIIILIAVLITFGTLVAGLGSMGIGGEYDAKHDTKLMFARVGMQAITLLLLLFAFYLSST
jgi:hypothetical protein